MATDEGHDPLMLLLSNPTTFLVDGVEEHVDDPIPIVYAGLIKVNMKNLAGCVTQNGINMLGMTKLRDDKKDKVILDVNSAGVFLDDDVAPADDVFNKQIYNNFIASRPPESRISFQEFEEKYIRSHAISYLRDRLIGNIRVAGILAENATNIPLIKKQVRECSGDQFVFIPLTLYPRDSHKVASHANGIIISKARGTVMRIEPQLKESELKGKTKDYHDNIERGIVKFAEMIGLSDPTVERINYTCPQGITDDKNCIFWTIFLTYQILKNLYKKQHPNITIQAISAKPKEELDTLMRNFKSELVTKIIPATFAFAKKTSGQTVSWPALDAIRARYGGNKNGFTLRHRRGRNNSKHGIKARKANTNGRRRTHRA